MLTPRLRGIDPLQPIQAPQYNVQEQSTDAVQQVALQSVNRAGQTVQQGNAANAQLYGQMAENIANVDNLRQMSRTFRRAPQAENGFGALGQVVTGILDTYQKMQQARREQLRGQALVQLETERQQLLTDSENILRSSEGYTGYQARIRDMLTRYGQYLNPEDMIETTAMLYAPAQDVMSEQARARYGTFEEIYNNNRETLQAQAVIQFEGRFQQLANARTPEEAQSTLQIINTEIQEFVSQLPPLEAGILAHRLWTSVQENYSGRAGEFANLAQSLEQYRDFATEVQGLLEKYHNGEITDLDYQAELFALETEYQQPHNSVFANPNINIDEQMQRFRQMEEVREAERRNEISAAESYVFTNTQLSVLAYTFATNVAARPYYEAMLGNNPGYEAAVLIADQLIKYQEESRRVADENANLAIQAQQLTTRSNEDFLSWFTSDTTSTTLQALGIGALFNDNLRSALGNLQNQEAVAQASPEQVRAWQQAVLDSRSEIQRLIQTRIQNNNYGLETIRQQLVPYGLDSPENIRELMQTAPSTLESISQGVRQTRMQNRLNFDPNLPPPNSSTPNFERPQLATVRRGNAEVILPFAPNVEFNWGGDNYGEQRETHTHAGEDIAIPVGTDLLWYGNSPGRVVRVRTDGNGYGLYVDIRDSDGNLHRFAHLSNTNVSEGDVINPGQFFGDSGNSGRSNGPHLHWEIRPNGGEEFGFNGTTNVIEFMSQFGNGNRQVRNDARNADTPPQAMQLDGNRYIMGNQVVDRRTNTATPLTATNNNPLRRNYASTSRADYNNDPSQNYGYSAIAQDRPFRLELHRVASRLGVPAQWLADVMAYESRGFTNDARNTRTNASGLIQFMPATARALGTSVEALRRMSRTEQLRYVEAYLRPFADRGELFSPYAVLMAVWSTPQNVRRLRENPQSVRRLSDGDITFEQYSRRLGSTAGREYTPLYGRPATHTTFHGSCSVCQSLIRSGSSIVPHEAG